MPLNAGYELTTVTYNIVYNPFGDEPCEKCTACDGCLVSCYSKLVSWLSLFAVC
uniref:Uncharacterized protein n=1 Tax=Anguilla anguilla TaxID=7936 RepID=A0A0E9WUQ1_ANGAN